MSKTAEHKTDEKTEKAAKSPPLAEPMDPPAGTPFVMHLMVLAEAGRVVTRLQTLGIVGDQIFARQPVGTGGNNLGADYLDEATIRDQGMTETQLYYLLKPQGAHAPEFGAYEQGQLLDQGVPGFIKLWAERNQGHSIGEAYGALLNVPRVYAAVQTALASLK